MNNMNYWPHTNIHELNLDWIISKVKELDTRFTSDIETFVREYIDEHFAEWTVNANYDPDDETIIYTNGTGATLTAGDVIRFAIDNAFVNVKDPTARAIGVTNADNISNLLSRMTAAEDAITAMPTTILNAIHPIGSEYITDTNTAPNIGGTWVLKEKQLQSVRGVTLATTDYTATSPATIDSVVMRRESNTVELRIIFSNVSISDTFTTLGNISPAACGLSNFGGGTHNYSFYSDTGNAIVSLVINPNGDISCDDVWKLSASAYPTNSYTGGLSAFTMTIPITSSDMLDSACDRFIWERTA